MAAIQNNEAMKRSILGVFLMSFMTIEFAEAQKVISLYSGKAPGSESWTWEEKENNKNLFNTRVIYNVSQPTLTVYLPDPAVANGTAVVIAPGGGFHTLSIDSEGIDVAKWLNTKGVTAFVLKYRLAHSLTDDPVKELMAKMGKPKLDEDNKAVVPLAVNDGLEAMKYVRSHAADYKINTNRIGFMGFSAGGTVTMGVTYQYTPETRPDFIAPIYAYLGALPKTPAPTDAPPAFIVVASDDQLGLAPNSAQIYSDWLTAKKPVEFHAYVKGGHGFGMRKSNIPTEKWYERFGEWLDVQGLLKK